MKKSILNLGKALNKAEQTKINGGENECGFISLGLPIKECPPGAICVGGKCRYILS